MFFLKVNKGGCLSSKEEKRLRTLARYHQTKTVIFGTEIIINDACTLLGDLHEIIDKEIYKFQTESKCPVIIDCGANIGISVIYFKRLYPEAKIIAFEPDPVLFKMLSQNILNFSFENIDLRQEAVWANNSGVNFLTEGGHSGCITEHGDQEKVIPVASCRLKELLESFNTIDFLKVDIEGAEHDVLFDCGESLERCNCIFIEYHSRKKQKQNLHNILKLFFDLGYRYHVHESFRRNHPFVDKNCIVDMDLQLNLFFYKELSQDE